MEKGILMAVATGVAAVFLYITFSQRHDATTDVLVADHQLQRAEFKKEFSKAAGEPTTPEQDKDIADARERLEKTRAAQDVVASDNKRDMDAMRGAAAKEIGVQPDALGKIKAQINSTGEATK